MPLQTDYFPRCHRQEPVARILLKIQQNYLVVVWLNRVMSNRLNDSSGGTIDWCITASVKEEDIDPAGVT